PDVDQALLHREQRRGGAGRDAGLLEDVLHVVAGGLDGDVERGRDLLIGETAGDEAHDLDLAVGQAGGVRAPVRRGGGLTGGADHRLDRVAIEAARGRL